MTPEEARKALVAHAGCEETLHLPGPVLAQLACADLPDDTRVGIGVMKKGVTHIEWDAALVRQGADLIVEVSDVWTRKYWYSPLNLEHHQDIVKRAVVAREQTRGDVRLLQHEDDGAFIHLNYEILGLPTTKSLRHAWDAARAIAEGVMQTPVMAIVQGGWPEPKRDRRA